MKRLFAAWVCPIVALCFVVAAMARAAEPMAGAIDDATALRAEITLLKKQIERQSALVDQLTRKVTRLEARLAAQEQDAPRSASPPTPTVSAEAPVAAADDEAPAAGVVAAVQRVVFVVDTSGSMIDKFSIVKAFVRDEIRKLPRDTSCNIVIAADGKFFPFKPEPVDVTPTSLREFDRFLDGLTTSGTSDMFPAMEFALKQRPDLVWFVTDGDMPNNNEFLQRLAAENRSARARINTVGAVTTAGDDTSASFLTFLQVVSTKHGGKFHLLDVAALAEKHERERKAAQAPQSRAPQPPRKRPVPAPPKEVGTGRGAARQVVFVIDGSRSMTDQFNVVKSEVLKAVEGMAVQGGSDASFNVLLAAAERVEVFRRRAIPAAPEVLTELSRFLDEWTPVGKSDVLPAMELAIGQNPNVVWLVTDGEVRNAPEFLAALRRANPAGRIRINTVVAGDATRIVSPETAKFIEFLSMIAATHGGKCIDLTGTQVDVQALNIDPPIPAPTGSGAGRGARESDAGSPKQRSILFDEL